MDTNFFKQAMSNEDGKPSGPKTLGLYWGAIAGVCILAGVYAYFTKKQDLSLFNASLGFVGTVATLMLGKEFLHKKFPKKTKPDA